MESCRQMSALKVKASKGAKEEEAARVPRFPTQDSGREVRKPRLREVSQGHVTAGSYGARTLLPPGQQTLVFLPVFSRALPTVTAQ